MVLIAVARNITAKELSSYHVGGVEGCVLLRHKGYSMEPEVMHLKTFLACQKTISSSLCSHISDVQNALADTMSRGNPQNLLCSQAQHRQTQMSPELLDLTTIKKQDWMSMVSTDLGRDIFEKA